MADASNSQSSKPSSRSLGSENHKKPPNADKSKFLYKALIVTIFLVLLPLFPSQAPEFINQTVHARSWELLQLIFVGIAVSYGLFSKKNDEIEKDNININTINSSSKFDNAQSYVSKLLQVSSVFDDEAENPTVFDENNKVQTWNSQYYRGEPVVVVAKENKEENSGNSDISQKPLLLPVRRLKQRAFDPVDVGSVDDGKTGSFTRSSSSNSGSKRFSSSSSRKSRNGEIGGEEKVEENVVLPSPIPWGSRSGRMEMKENENGMETHEPEYNRLESRSSRSSRPNPASLSPKNLSLSPSFSPKNVSPSQSISSPKNLSPTQSISSPKNLSPSSSFSSEFQAKNIQDFVRKKSFNKSSPPPAPPPPPPPFLRKSVLLKSNSSVTNNPMSSHKELRRSIRSVPAEEPSDIELEEPPRRANFGSELRTKMQSDGSLFGRSVRTIRPREFHENSSNSYETNSDVYTTNFMTENAAPKQAFVEIPKEEKNSFMDKVVVETTDDETDVESEEEDYFGENRGNGEATNSVSEEASTDHSEEATADVGPDVDKKADEFIAKFREQIRLQRLNSIRRSAAQRAGKALS